VAVRASGVDLRWLLRTWRTAVAEVSQAVAARSVGVSVAALSMWENGRRRIEFSQLQALDRCYGADGALVDLALALGTPDGLPARRLWAHNPQGPSSPRWAWLRPRSGAGSVEAQLLWGAFAFDCSGACDDRGLFVTSPVSMPNPPVWVRLLRPGWVDFGRGLIPQQLGIPSFPALSVARLAGGGQTPAGLVAPEVVDRFLRDEAFADAVLKFFGRRPDLVRRVFSAVKMPPRIVDLTLEAPSSDPLHRPFTGQQFRDLRTARGLSQADAAHLASELMPGSPISDDQISLLERGGNPQPVYIRSRLDRVYRADGVCCLESVPPERRRSRFTFEFPNFWIGPIWFTFRAAGATERGLAALHWGLASKQMMLRSGTTVTCRRPMEDTHPFVVSCPDRWRVVGGMGTHAAAHDVNWGWVNRDDASERGDADVHELFLGLFGRTLEEFTRLQRSLD
jgi:transcriptional regulator with XRE-family HTH domain